MEVNVKVPGFEKLVDYTASGIGSIAGSMLAPWRAQREVEAKQIAAKGDANVLLIQADAQAKAREILVSQDTDVTGELDIASTVNQRILFQERKRQANIESVVTQAAYQLGDKEVSNHEPDHDWTARFFNDVQDVSSEEMQALWAKVLAGEVERTGSTSIRTLGILKNLDKATANLFRNLCSICVSIRPDGINLEDARVPFLGNYSEGNELRDYGFDYGSLNLLNEHGLIISEYNSWRDYNVCITAWPSEFEEGMWVVPFSFQGRYWLLTPMIKRSADQEFRLHGVSLTKSGQELSMVVEQRPDTAFANELQQFFSGHQLQMVEVDSGVRRRA